MTQYRACAATEVPAGTAIRVVLGDREVCVARTEDGVVRAVDDLCTHGEVSLAEGDVEGCSIECWLHGSAFSLVTGEAQGPPAFEPVEVFTTSERDGDVYVDIPA
ncbi:Rieske (2Fe-2S) protein [Brevibacterium litoralis]|uniref:Rieske (2Fe-2S) protein n=1 Tax=Brevibacterium litoralis TaxID=3138935 RepID=UPI0032EB1A2E